MLFCCKTGTCAACKTERRLAAAAIVVLVGFTAADNSNPDLKLMPPLGLVADAVANPQSGQKFGQRLDGTTPPLPAKIAAVKPPAAASNAPALPPQSLGGLVLRTSLK